MRFFSSFVISSVLLLCTLRAQDLENLFEAAHYRLINTSQDVLGLQDSIQLVNAPYDGNNGVYSNGIYVGHDPENGALIQTPMIDAMYDSVFAVQVLYRLTDLDGESHPVIILGPAYRFLGFEVWSDNTFKMLINNGELHDVAGLTANQNEWNELTIIHHEDAAHTEFWHSTELIGTIDGVLMRSETDGRVINVNGASGKSFKGNWRNLRIYGAEAITSIDALTPATAITLLNPAGNNLQIFTTNKNPSAWRIYDLQGMLISTGAITSEHRIDISELQEGLYVLHVLDVRDEMIGVGRFVKAK